MKKTVFAIIVATIMMSSCSNNASVGTYVGAQFGTILGSAIGGIIGGPRGSDIGTVIGMADRRLTTRRKWRTDGSNRPMPMFTTHGVSPCNLTTTAHTAWIQQATTM